MNERDQKICDNLKLVHYTIWRNFPNYGNDDDIYQIGCIGLIKAIDTFDNAKGIPFGSYASQCICNEIRTHFRKEKRWSGQISLETVLTGDNDNTLRIDDLLFTEDDDPRIIIAEYETALNDRERAILHYLLIGESQRCISKQLGLSPNYICRIVRKMRTKWNKGV